MFKIELLKYIMWFSIHHYTSFASLWTKTSGVCENRQSYSCERVV